MNRPDGDPAKTTTVAPGSHGFDGYQAVWWDPHALALDAGSSFGLRRDDLIAKDGDAAGSAARLAAYQQWESERAGAIAEARRPSIVSRTVTQIAADRDLWDLPAKAGSHPSEIDAASEIAPASEIDGASEIDPASEINATSEIGAASESGVASGFSRKAAAGGRTPDNSIQIDVVDVGRTAGRPYGPQFGSLVHTTLATVPLDADESIVRRVASTQARILLGSGSGIEEEAYAVAEAVMAVLRHPLFDQVRTASRSGRCYRELPLIWQASDGTLIEGTIDLAFDEPGLPGTGRQTVVLDFKTDRELDVEGQRYRRQLAVYCQGLKALRGGSVRGVLMRV